MDWRWFSVCNAAPAVAVVVLLLLQITRYCDGGDELLSARIPLYKDASQPIPERVKDLLTRMTLDEKLGQMMQIDHTVANKSVIAQFFIGSVLSGGGGEPVSRASPSDWADMIDGFQEAALSTRLSIPLIYGVDAVHGHNNLYNATIFPHNIGLGCTREPDLVRRVGAATALEVRATGIPYAFAPCLAVCRHPSWGRCYESFGEHPELVKNMTDIILGLQGQTSTPYYPTVASQENVMATAKHYVGDGGTTNGIDEGNANCSYQELLDIHLVPFYDAIAKGVSSVMISYSSWNGVKMHTSQELITGYLKKELNFQGFVITDWQGIDRITNPPHIHYEVSVNKSINAGVDMVMLPYDYEVFYNDVMSHIERGSISMDRIDDAVERILRVKYIAGVFEYPYTNRSLFDTVGSEVLIVNVLVSLLHICLIVNVCNMLSQKHRDLARETVRKSLVLLKNGHSVDSPVLPLNKNAMKILVAGSHAHNLGFQCGGWTGSWQGYGGNNITEKGDTILEAVQQAVGLSTQIIYEELPSPNTLQINDFNYAIVAVGENPYAEYIGDNTNLTIPDYGVKAIQAVCNAMTCVVVLISGRPLLIEPYLPMIDAFVAAWLPGTEARGITDVLFGDYNFQGKLSRTWFRSVDQLPMNVGDPNYDPLFPFGYGLSMKAISTE